MREAPVISRRGLGAMAATVLVAAAVSAVLQSADTSSAAVTSLSVSGNRLVNDSGQTVTLRGVNRSGTEYACIQGWGIFDGPSDAASVQAIASWHTNAVRVPLNEDCWLGINGAATAYSGQNYITAITNYVNLLNQNGLYAILELHWSAPGTTQATGQNPMPDQSHSPAFWSSVAGTFKANHAVLFDLFNEPYPDSNQNTIAAWACWKNGGTCSGVSYQVAGMQSLVTAIRSAGATNVVLLGGIQYGNTLSQWGANAPTDSAGQLAASFHTYSTNACVTTACWNASLTAIGNVPLVTGEIGEADGQATFINSYMAWADAHGASYLAWTWNLWGCGSGIALITNFNGTPCAGYGVGYQAHLAGVATTTTTAGPTTTAAPTTTTSTTVPPTTTTMAPTTTTTSTTTTTLPTVTLSCPANVRCVIVPG